MSLNSRTVNEAAQSWVASILELLENISQTTRKSSLPDLLAWDLSQFQALSDHLQMLLSTRPSNSWEIYHWSINFSFFLSQLIRRSEQLFEHLADYSEADQFKVSPRLVADLFCIVRLANRLPNLY